MLGLAPRADAGTANALTGSANVSATFTLQKETAGSFANEGAPQVGTTFNFTGLDDEVYRVVASSTECNPSISAEKDLTDPADQVLAVDAFALVCDFVPLTPKRLLETRATNTNVNPDIIHINPSSTVPAGNTSKAAENSITKVRVAGGDTGVPANALGVSLNVTGVESATSDNFLTIWDCSDGALDTTLEPDPPLASNLNLVQNDARPNAAITKVGTGDNDDLVCIYARRATHIIVDITGYFPAPASTHMSFDAAPVRLLETRLTNASSIPPITQTGYVGGQPQAGQIITLDVGGSNEVDAILNITGTQAAGGFVTVWDCTDTNDVDANVEPDPPTASTLNLEPGVTSANLAITQTDGGEICLYTSNVTHLIVDRIGWFNPGTVSNYVSNLPRRVLETRATNNSANPPIQQIGHSGSKPSAGSKIILDLDVDPEGDATAPVPVGTKAVVLNGTQSDGGFVTVYPCVSTSDPGTPPTASNLNLVSGESRPNLVVTDVTDGKVCLFTQGSTHLVADLVGYFPG